MVRLAKRLTIPQAKVNRFNALNLPAYANKQGAVHVTPDMAAMMAVQHAQGRVPLPIEQMVAAAVAHLDSPVALPHHANLLRDLASRGQPVLTRNLEEMVPDPRVREAATALIDASALSTAYCYAQLEPHHGKQLAAAMASGDVPLMQHYWLAGMHDWIERDKFEGIAPYVPEGLKRTHNGVLWPPEFTAEMVTELRGRKWTNALLGQQVLSPETRIRPAAREDPNSFEVGGQYFAPISMNSHPELGVIADMIARRMGHAAQLLQSRDAEFADMVTGLGQFIGGHEFFGNDAADAKWATTDGELLATYITRAEYYFLFRTPHNLKNLMQSHVGVADATAQAYARKFVALADTAHAALVTIWPEGDSPIDPLGPPLTVDISQIVHQGGNANSAYYPVGGNNLPNKNRFRNPKAARPQRFVIFPHISRYRAQNQGLPVAREICAPAFARRIEAALTNRHAAGLSSMAHETMHSDGIDPYIPRAIHGVSGEMSLEDYYAGLAAKYEEGSADLLGMLMLRVAEQEGVIDRKTRNDTVVIKLANMLRNFFLNDEKHYGFASRRYWQLFLKHGIFTLEGDGKYHFHMARLWARLDDVIREYMDEYGSRDKDRVFAARDKHMRAFSQSAMAAAVRRVSARIPLYDRPQYRVQGYTPGLVAPDLAV